MPHMFRRKHVRPALSWGGCRKLSCCPLDMPHMFEHKQVRPALSLGGCRKRRIAWGADLGCAYNKLSRRTLDMFGYTFVGPAMELFLGQGYARDPECHRRHPREEHSSAQ